MSFRTSSYSLTGRERGTEGRSMREKKVPGFNILESPFFLCSFQRLWTIFLKFSAVFEGFQTLELFSIVRRAQLQVCRLLKLRFPELASFWLTGVKPIRFIFFKSTETMCWISSTLEDWILFWESENNTSRSGSESNQRLRRQTRWATSRMEKVIYLEAVPRIHLWEQSEASSLTFSILLAPIDSTFSVHSKVDSQPDHSAVLL